MSSPRHREAVFELGVDNGVTTDNEGSGLVNLFLAAGENLAEHVERKLARWERDDVHRRQRLSSHRVNVGQCVGGGDLTEIERVVDDWRKKIHRLHEGEVVRQAKDPGVVEGLPADEQSRIWFLGKRGQRA